MVSSSPAATMRSASRRSANAERMTGQLPRTVTTTAITTAAIDIRQPMSSNGSKSPSCFQ